MKNSPDQESRGWTNHDILRSDAIKYVFDYIRNIGISGSLIAGGDYLREHPEFFKAPAPLNDAFGWTIGGIGLALLVLNYAHASSKVDDLKLPKVISVLINFLINVLSMVVMILIALKK
ncbi:MAG: hypothetical protein J0I77_17640 [Rudaea sp.]|uniref:hypothetical protein n=1 Tax=unclassified Rudaea TaxID=2627037 RepID=UPI0010F81BAA|nr:MULTISPECIES: hypothetical protein [unclassified Rudaea]MBN8887551.1 hypothetical protein [Rudaea sp.]